MNYQKIYDSLIEKRKAFPLTKHRDGTVETHHILMKALGGKDDPKNLVNLTVREHFVAHRLLEKIYQGTKFHALAVLAIDIMLKYKGRKLKCSSRVFEHVKKLAAQSRSSLLKGKVPWNKGIPASKEHREKNRQAQLGKKRSEEARKNYSIAAKKRKPPKKFLLAAIKWHTGRKTPTIVRQKISKSLKNRQMTILHRIRLSISNLNRSRKRQNLRPLTFYEALDELKRKNSKTYLEFIEQFPSPENLDMMNSSTKPKGDQEMDHTEFLQSDELPGCREYEAELEFLSQR